MEDQQTKGVLSLSIGIIIARANVPRGLKKSLPIGNISHRLTVEKRISRFLFRLDQFI